MFAIIRARDVSECCTLVTHGVFRITKEFQETMRARFEALHGIKALISTIPDAIEFEDYNIEFFKQDVFETSNPEFYNFLEEMEGCILFEDSAIPDALIEICDGKEPAGHERIDVSPLRQKWYMDRPLEPEWIGYADTYYPIEVDTENIPVKEILEVKL